MVSISLFGSSSKDEAETSTSGKSNTDGSDNLPEPPKKNEKPLDIVFLQDTTGSQGEYIKAARKAIRDICDKISASAQFPKDFIRFGLIAFRDHPPQDSTYVTKSFGFTSDISVMQKNLTNLVASGGGDGPEAQTAALAAALDLEWTEDAIKIVILITDAPPHGLGESGDGFDRSPDQNDPLAVVRQMAERGITLFVIACEPSLSQQYRYALDFYSALVSITSGRLFPLLMADKLGDYIVGTAIETIETEQLISEFEHVIVDDVYAKAKSIEEVMAEVQKKLQNRGTKLQTMEIENVYEENEQGMQNRKSWFAASSLGEARARVQPIYVSRMKGEFVPSAPSYAARRGSLAPLLPPTGAPSVEPWGIPTPVPFASSTDLGISPKESSFLFDEEQEEEEEELNDDDNDYEEEELDDDDDDYEEAKKSSLHKKTNGSAGKSAPAPGPPPPPPAPAAYRGLSPASPSAYNPLMSATLSAASAAPAPPQVQTQEQQQPKVTLERTEFNSAQARRLVMQSLTRNSKVTATGLVSKTGETAGQSVSIGEYVAE